MNKSPLIDTLEHVASQFEFTAVVAVGEIARPLATQVLSDRDISLIELDLSQTHLPPADLRADWALVAGEFPDLGPNDSAQLLSRLRDLTVPRFTVVVRADSTAAGWRRSDLAAFALDHVGEFEHCDGASFSVYQYDVLSYKKTPDWLNSDYWANPERWGKDRW